MTAVEAAVKAIMPELTCLLERLSLGDSCPSATWFRAPQGVSFNYHLFHNPTNIAASHRKVRGDVACV